MAETIFNNPLEHEVSRLNSQITNFTSGAIDLNNYKTTGMYSYNGNTSSNSPTTGTCTLIVQKYSNDFVTQMVTAVRSTGNLVYTRSFYDGTTWSAWRELAYSDQMTTLNSKFAKVLWEGNKFTSGSLSIPEMSNYKTLLFLFSDTISLIVTTSGSNQIIWGGKSYAGHASDSIETVACRYEKTSSESISITSHDRGYTNGTKSNYSGFTEGLIRVVGLV